MERLLERLITIRKFLSASPHMRHTHPQYISCELCEAFIELNKLITSVEKALETIKKSD